MRTNESPVFRVRMLPPKSAQALHELLQGEFSDHDQVECYCCCFDCPGWTEDMEVVSDEEISDLIPVHDLRGGKPFPKRKTSVSGLQGKSGGA